MIDSRHDRSRLEQFRAMEKETTDPFAARLVHEIVTELEARLERARRRTPESDQVRTDMRS
ncbi:MAG: hypothetical protein AB7I42_12885 [Bradyrhizobium sp.]|uniref:hypothetical protein n=1 Tax=Bradyrhizobium sp. TaxID=376 RepID=UPI002A2EFC1F|nr:hypothetical protein [Bradyrhizobium sp.]